MSPRLQPCPHPLCTRSHNRNCSRTERLYFLAAPVVQPDPSLRWTPLLRQHPPDQPVLPLPLFLSLLLLPPGQSARPRLSFLEDQSALRFPPRPSLLPDQPPLSSPAVQPPLWLRLLPSLLPDQSAQPLPAVRGLPSSGGCVTH